MKAISLGFWIILTSINCFAGRVRTLPTTSQEMPLIHLMTGRSTVLRFPSAPKKVIVGNQNYFNVEFIDSDVTLQPLGNTSSNIFVYGDGFTYGFILKVDRSNDYDDLVIVKTKMPIIEMRSITKEAAEKLATKKDLKFEPIKLKASSVELQGDLFKWSEKVNCYYADLFLTLKKGPNIQITTVQFKTVSQDKDLTAIKPVFECETLGPQSKCHARIFANIKPQMKIAFKISTNNWEDKIDLRWRK